MYVLDKMLLTSGQLFLLLIVLYNTSYASKIDDLVIEGEKEFLQRCALCHGGAAKGDGPYSFALVFKPADLTQLLIENNGYFPFLEVYLSIDGLVN